MGGYGSGPSGWSAKTTVEDCTTLNIEKLFRYRLIGPWSGGGTLVWTSTRTGEEKSSVGFWVKTDFEDRITLTLKYTVTRQEEKTDIEEPIQLTFTTPNYGGKRWWFLCPLVKNGRLCNRRVGRLHLAPGGLYFGCRHCYNLTYTSCQESHQFDRLYAQMARDLGGTPADVKRAFAKRF